MASERGVLASVSERGEAAPGLRYVLATVRYSKPERNTYAILIN